MLACNYKTKNTLLSLALGAFLYSLLASNYNIDTAFLLLTKSVLKQLQFEKLTSISTIFEAWSIFVFLFILMLGIIVELMQQGGSFNSFKNCLAKLTNKGKNIQIISLCMSKLLMVDDYLSCLTVGKMMSGVFDKFKITRTKLAFLVDSMAAPLAILCPISSWSAVIIGVFQSAAFQNSNLKVHFAGNSLTQHFYVLPYLFYSFAILFACWFVVLTKTSFGDMDKNVYLGKEKDSESLDNSATLADFFIPMGALFAGIVVFNLMFGEYILFGGTNNLVQALQSSNTAAALFFASLFAMLLATAWLIYRRQLDYADIVPIYGAGIKKVYGTIFILLLSWTIGTILTQNLNIGTLIVSYIGSDASISGLPVILFLLSLMTGLITGTSWGTVAIVAPIAISICDSMYLQSGMTMNPWLLMICIGSTMSGSIAGDHLSPISSTTVMTAASTEVTPLAHTKTQLCYSVPVVFSTVCAFYLSTKLVKFGVLCSTLVPMLMAITSISLILYFFTWRHKQAQKVQAPLYVETSVV